MGMEKKKTEQGKIKAGIEDRAKGKENAVKAKQRNGGKSSETLGKNTQLG